MGKEEIYEVASETKSIQKYEEEQIVILNRQLKLHDGVSIVIGIIIGSGIFATSGSVLKYVESIGISLFVWIAAGILTLLAGLCYSELGSAIPSAGGDFTFLNEGLHPIIGFLFIWASFFCLKTGSQAIIGIIFARYFYSAIILQFTEDTEFLADEDSMTIKLLAVMAIITITILNIFTVKGASILQNICFILKFVAVFSVIGFAIGGLASGKTLNVAEENFTNLFPGSDRTWMEIIQSIGIAAISALWAYDGVNNVTNISEEIVNPERNLPIAIIFGVCVVIACYVAINLSFLCVLTAQQVMDSPAVAVEMAGVVLGAAGEVLIGLLVSFSAIGTLNGSILTGGRAFYAAARENLFIFPKYLSMLSSRFQTPFVSLIVQMFVAILYVFPGSLQALVNYFGFTSWIFYSCTGIALIRLRYSQKDLPRPFKVKPFPIIPIIFIGVSWFIVICTLLQDPIPSCIAIVFILVGIPVYFLFFWRGNQFLALWQKIRS